MTKSIIRQELIITPIKKDPYALAMDWANRNINPVILNTNGEIAKEKYKLYDKSLPFRLATNPDDKEAILYCGQFAIIAEMMGSESYFLNTDLKNTCFDLRSPWMSVNSPWMSVLEDAFENTAKLVIKNVSLENIQKIYDSELYSSGWFFLKSPPFLGISSKEHITQELELMGIDAFIEVNSFTKMYNSMYDKDECLKIFKKLEVL
ncbi:MAG: hypothetical protein GY793_09285 [Proteobacteria bacterium]|nr:hypothetical protein [Pseudomonadota bacterium]